MHLVVGDDTGLVKWVDVQRCCVVRTLRKQAPGEGVIQLKWHDPSKQSKLAVALQNGVVECWTDSVLESQCESGVDDMAAFTLAPSARYYYVVARSGAFHVLPFAAAGDAARSSFQCGSDARCVDVHPARTHEAAVAGKECLLRIWDVTTHQAVFKARNVPHDMLNLRRPVWVTALSFSPPQPHILVTGTAHHELRLYDTRVGRRPVLDVTVGDYAVRSVAIHANGNLLAVGDSAGQMRQLDARTGRIVAGFHGVAGAVRALEYHPSLPLLACGALDRLARVYNVENGRLVSSTYVKQRVSSVLWNEVNAETKAGEEKEEKEEEAKQGDMEEEEGAEKKEKKKKKKKKKDEDCDEGVDEVVEKKKKRKKKRKAKDVAPDEQTKETQAEEAAVEVPKKKKKKKKKRKAEVGETDEEPKKKPKRKRRPSTEEPAESEKKKKKKKKRRKGDES